MASIWGSIKSLVGADKYGQMTDQEKQLAMQQDLNQIEREQQQYLAENQTKWNMQGMQNAGLNPILAVGGAHSATTAGNVGTPDLSSAVTGITSAVKAGATIAMAIATKNPGLLIGKPKTIKGFR